MCASWHTDRSLSRRNIQKKIISNITKKREGRTRTVVVKRANSCDSGEIEETKTSAVSFFKLFSFILFCKKEKKW